MSLEDLVLRKKIVPPDPKEILECDQRREKKTRNEEKKGEQGRNTRLFATYLMESF